LKNSSICFVRILIYANKSTIFINFHINNDGFIWNIWQSHYKACPLHNVETRKLVLEHGPKIVEEASKQNIKIVNQYHSGLEHTFLFIQMSIFF
jgi:hypothetical protein